MLFAFQETKISICNIKPYRPDLLFCDYSFLYKDLEFQIILPKKKREMIMDLNIIKKLKLLQYHISFQECEVFYVKVNLTR